MAEVTDLCEVKHADADWQSCGVPLEVRVGVARCALTHGEPPLAASTTPVGCL